jgi:hypothetical protein
MRGADQVLADGAFARAATEEAMCRILARPSLAVRDELTTYHAVPFWRGGLCLRALYIFSYFRKYNMEGCMVGCMGD